MTPKEEFIQLLTSTQRAGIDDVIQQLEELGFFEAPASTRFHLNYEGGLLEHSLNVYRTAMGIRQYLIGANLLMEKMLPADSVAIAALLHDVCKADIYRPVMKRKKNAFGVWEDEPGYDVDYSSFPLGHGEKSVIVLLLCGLDLTDDEIMAIRWHMTAWDLPFQSNDIKGNLNAAKDRCPLLTLIQAADGISSNIIEETR